MTVHSLNPSDQLVLLRQLDAGQLVVACLCAEWCTNCREYRRTFESLQAQISEAVFVWIDIEDEADWLGDQIDIDNFPTLLLQRGQAVSFYGPVEPGAATAARLIQHALTRTEAALLASLATSKQQQHWQASADLYQRLNRPVSG